MWWLVALGRLDIMFLQYFQYFDDNSTITLTR